jgi:septal ring-binding cell division protein DamX
MDPQTLRQINTSSKCRTFQPARHTMKTYNRTLTGIAILGLLIITDRVALAQKSDKDPTTIDSEADNTARNARELSEHTLAPLNQGKSKADVNITMQIRKEIMEGETMSASARNVNIITIEGRVTLRGLVNTAKEKHLIGDIADRLVLSKNVDNQLEVKLATTDTTNSLN